MGLYADTQAFFKAHQDLVSATQELVSAEQEMAEARERLECAMEDKTYAENEYMASIETIHLTIGGMTTSEKRGLT